MHNYFLIEHNYSQIIIYNFKSELKFWNFKNVVKIIIVMIVIAWIIIQYFFFFFCNYLRIINIFIIIIRKINVFLANDYIYS